MTELQRGTVVVLAVDNRPPPARVVIVGAAWVGKGVCLLGVAVLLLVGGLCKAAGHIAPVLLDAGNAVLDAITGES